MEQTNTIQSDPATGEQNFANYHSETLFSLPKLEQPDSPVVAMETNIHDNTEMKVCFQSLTVSNHVVVFSGRRDTS